VLVLLLLAAFGPRLPAEALDGTLEVRSAYVTVDGGVFQLNVQTLYPLNDQIRGALLDGVTLTFDLQAIVDKRRRLWFDATIVDVTRHFELAWHAVSERFIVRDGETGGQETFATLEQALARVGTVESWPVVVEPQLEPDAAYEVRVRAHVRRGTMPDALRSVIFWSDGWHRSSEWYSWSLPR
jgi:hypothetical protein